MEIKDIKALVKIITESDISEFEMENEVERIHIRRGAEKEYIQVGAPVLSAAPPAQVAAATTVQQGVSEKPVADGSETINSPIVGTFYRKPSPEASNFVDVGSTVEKGQTVCLIEAMKLFNEIEAEFKCKIVEILKDDASPVGYGEPLFKVQRL